MDILKQSNQTLVRMNNISSTLSSFNFTLSDFGITSISITHLLTIIFGIMISVQINR